MNGGVIRGKVGFRHDGGEEIVSAGDAYFVGPGHTPVLYPDTEVVEFSPSDELAQTIEVVSKNLQAAAPTKERRRRASCRRSVTCPHRGRPSPGQRLRQSVLSFHASVAATSGSPPL